MIRPNRSMERLAGRVLPEGQVRAVLAVVAGVRKQEQRQRLLVRLEQPEKHWKFSLEDVHERKRWGDYMRAYEDMIRLRCVYLNTITWSMHSRRTEPINRSTQKGLGVRGAAWCRRWSVRLRRGIDHGFAAKGPGAQKNSHNGDDYIRNGK